MNCRQPQHGTGALFKFIFSVQWLPLRPVIVFASALSRRPALRLEESITHERNVCFCDTSEWAFLSYRFRNGCWKRQNSVKKNMQKQSECSGWETGTGVPNKLWCSRHVSDVSAALKRMQCRMLFSWLFCMKIWKNNFDFQWKAAWNATFLKKFFFFGMYEMKHTMAFYVGVNLFGFWSATSFYCHVLCTSLFAADPSNGNAPNKHFLEISNLCCNHVL